MSQSGFIAACLLGGFVIWLAANNKLSKYGQILWSGAPAQSSGGSTASTAAGALSAWLNPKSILDIGVKVGTAYITGGTAP